MSTPTWSVYDDEDDDREILTEGESCEEPHQQSSCRSLKSYRKVRVLSRGAQGVIYLATDPLESRGEPKLVVIKRYFTNFKNLHSRGVAETTLRELALLQQLRHPNILRFYNPVLGPDDTICAAAEYCPIDLATLVIDNKKRLSTAEVRWILHSLLEALQYLKAQEIVHRDMKPSNVLIAEDGTVKLGDFGSARLQRRGERLTPATQRVTLLYRPPEALLGDPNYSAAVDMWGLGVLFAELLLNRYLFTSGGEIGVIGEVFGLIGTPTMEQWPEMKDLPSCATFQFSNIPSTLEKRFPPSVVDPIGRDLLAKLLSANPNTRITPEGALKHPFLTEDVAFLSTGSGLLAASAKEVRESITARQAQRTQAAQRFKGVLALGMDDDDEDDC